MAQKRYVVMGAGEVGFHLARSLPNDGHGALLLGLGRPDLVTAATASAATLGNIGPGLEAVGPTANFEFFGYGQKVLMVLLMWLGRLEVYSIAALFTRAYWRT